MRAEQGGSEEYKSQLGGAGTSRAILHGSASTFGAGGPGQRRRSHTCTHTRMHTCTHSCPQSPAGFLLFLFLLAVLFLHLSPHLPGASAAASQAFFLDPWQVSGKDRRREVPSSGKKSVRGSPETREHPGKLTQGARGSRGTEDSSLQAPRVHGAQTIQEGPEESDPVAWRRVQGWRLVPGPPRGKVGEKNPPPGAGMLWAFSSRSPGVGGRKERQEPREERTHLLPGRPPARGVRAGSLTLH